ncbi:Vacuolar transporter chaperone 2 [Ceratocystis platani]|uniref:Vacuolar transporter chaperone 2 n=1 Tax=Ceratocystis fimbriata f. sp. platani TaxID=88771 RepID=A0A0F8D3N6_CERFI|nr:Vacuolar transporter chaperone 2 [Ceratocystis platani]
MRFGKTLQEAQHGPWKDMYIDYAKLKSLLREDKYDDDEVPWTETDENKFCDEIFNNQLEKVAKFQEDTFNNLKDRVEVTYNKLKGLATEGEGEGEDDGPSVSMSKEYAKQVESELDDLTEELRQLKKYSSINYTGFLKIVKKHDRKRGDHYKVRPMMQLSLSKRPFNSEKSYTPLINKLSVMYYIVRQHSEKGEGLNFHPELDIGVQEDGKHTAHKFWVHPDNLLEVKTYILRRLPALVYAEQAASVDDASNDPTITSLYFDGPKFSLYSKKVERNAKASSLRLRWYGDLNSVPELKMEEKTVHASGSAEEHKFDIKQKWIKPYLDGQYKMERSIAKMERQGQQAIEIDAFKATTSRIQESILSQKLAPVLRATYVRTAFQQLSDDRVRISIDTDVAFIREDTLDLSRPCRDPASWHRTDIDNSNMKYPFSNINQSEISKFPYAILEIKLQEGRKRPEWVEDLMGSHLVYPAPGFSKFVHGVASLFEDYVNALPFWISELEGDIRKDPKEAFDEEVQRRIQKAEDEQIVGSLLGAKVGSSFKPTTSSPVAEGILTQRAQAEMSGVQPSNLSPSSRTNTEDEVPARTGISSVLPSFSMSRYAQNRRAKQSANSQELPEGVVEPEVWIKNSGELKIEPKVWLANERTFLKWQHISILLGGLAVALYSAAGKDTVAEIMGITYIIIAIFAGGWGYTMMNVRRRMIHERSGRDFDNVVGPLIIAVAMAGALVVNFFLEFRKAFYSVQTPHNGTSSSSYLGNEL